MYKEKLLSQMEFLEKLQSQCSTIDVTEAVELGRQILLLAKQIDELEVEKAKSGEDAVNVKLDAHEIYKAVQRLGDKYKSNHQELTEQ